MSTIKAYTDIEQSKVLAEILPLESADMFYKAGNDAQPTFRLRSYGHIMSDKDVCAWSLAALLSVLPNYQLQTQDDGIGVLCSCNGKFIIVTADNPVDACYEIIIKLHKLNLS